MIHPTFLLSLYLASDTLCFWPPDKLIPFSPISVESPPGKIFKSDLNAHASITFSYNFEFAIFPNRIFSLTEAFCIQACCGTYAILPFTLTLPEHFSSSPKIDETKEDLPEPTVPRLRPANCQQTI